MIKPPYWPALAMISHLTSRPAHDFKYDHQSLASIAPNGSFSHSASRSRTKGERESPQFRRLPNGTPVRPPVLIDAVFVTIGAALGAPLPPPAAHRRRRKQPQEKANLFLRELPNKSSTNEISFQSRSDAQISITSLILKRPDQPCHMCSSTLLRGVHESGLMGCKYC